MLSRLEIQGFKSFAQKTVLEFPKGICAIVGPNGSGKSNIVDAIRWVLGEQSLKNLRSEKSDDVIFAGTPQRPATSLASVSLHFENTKQIFPLPYPEVAIGRKLYRDSTSEYLINNAATRLKEIAQLLAAAKLGVRGLSIISQGAGDIFLRASGEERREMLEEMLGLNEFRLKKEDAERKIKETTQNLHEASRILEELEPYLRSLKRQASRWERRQEKEATLKTREANYFLRKIEEIRPGRDALAGERTALAKEIEVLRREIKKEEEELQKLEAALPHASSEIEELRARLRQREAQRSETSRAIGKIEGQIEALGNLPQTKDLSQKILLEKLIEAKTRLGEIAALSDFSSVKQELGKLLRNLDEFLKAPHPDESATRLLEESKEKLAVELSRIEKEIQELSGALASRGKAEEHASGRFREVLEGLEKMRRDLREKENILREYQFEEEKRHLKEEDLRAKMREAGLEYDSFLKNPPAADPIFAAEPLEDLETKILRLRRELAEIGLVDEEILREYEETAKKVDFIKTQKEDLEKALKDLEALSQELEKRIRHDFSAGLHAISEAFNHYFKLIFGGGNAKIAQKFTHPLPAENGNGAEPLPEVEVMLSIPRKKIRGIEMLSGGERALTSIAVLFSIVGTSAPPFLVLDEVDAALDETNSWRFANLLRELSGKTQFIVITHNRATMEVAEVLYGVTMEDGVSKIFSLKFEEAEKVAAKDVHAPVDE